MPLRSPRTLLATALLALAGHAGAADAPYTLGATYTGDLMKNTQGGLQRETRYIDQLSLTADLDT